MKVFLIPLLLLSATSAGFGSPLLSTADRASLQAAVATHQHRIEAHDDGRFSTPRCTLGGNLVFDDTGFTVQTTNGSWGLEMTQGAALHTSASANQLHRVCADGITEWFINDERGLEQGWILSAPVDGIEMRVRGSLPAQITRECVSFGSALNYTGLKAWDASGRDVPVWFEATASGFAVRYDDDQATYPITIDPLAQTTYFKASNTDAQDQFGEAIAISGNTVVIGAYAEDSNATTINGDQADNSAALAGAAYVFVRNGSTWMQQAYLKAPNAEAGDVFGTSVAISGDTLVVGATGEDSNATGVNGNRNDNSALGSGAAYVFTRSGSTWMLQAYLKASNTEAGDAFGISLAIDGNSIVVGASFEASNSGNQSDNSMSRAGAAYVFARTGNTWAQQAYLKSSNPSANGFFAGGVAISGDTVVVSEPGNNSNAPNSGAAFVFTRTAGVWSQQALLKASNAATNDGFGVPAIYGDTIVVGAYAEDSNATGIGGNEMDNSAVDSGAAYIFTRTAGVWSQQAYLKASNAQAGDQFGYAVSIFADTLVVGAAYEDSGIPGNEADNSGSAAGAAYVFRRRGTTWAQQSYLKASNPGSVDFFGQNVAIVDGIVLVGADRESSNATGINGNAGDNSALSAGAAYLFEDRRTLTSLSRSYQPAPGGPDLTYRVPGYAAISPTGEVLFENSLSGIGAPKGKTKGMFSTIAGPTDMTLQTGTVVGGMLGMAAGVKVTDVFGAVHNRTVSPGVFQASVSGTSITTSNNRLVLVDNGSYVMPIFRTGVPVAALANAVPVALNEVLQQPSTGTDLALSYRLGGVPASTDSGVLFIDHNGSVTDATVREGSMAPGGGFYGQIGRVAQIETDTKFIAKWIPAVGQAAKDAVFTPTMRNTALQGDLAGGTTLGERYGIFTGLTQAANFGMLRATLAGSATTTNEGVWLDVGQLVLRKGDAIGGGLTISRIIRVWGVNTIAQIVVQVELSGPGVTSANKQALIVKSLLMNDAQILARAGSPAPGIYGNIKLAAFSAIDVDPASGNYVCLVTLSGAASNANLALIAGKTTLGNSTTQRDLRLPDLVLRKGGRYRSSLTPDDSIVSIALKPAVDASGVGGRGLGQVINDDGQMLVVLTGNSGAVELVRIEP